MDDLWEEYRAGPGPELRNRLVVQYAPLVKYVVGRLGIRLPEHVDQQDLVSEGVIGLMGAIDRFDPEREIRFESFAIPRIHGAIMDSLRSQDWLPRRTRTEIKRMEQTRSELEAQLGAAPTDQEVADAMGSTARRVAQLDGTNTSARLQSLDEITAGGGDHLGLDAEADAELFDEPHQEVLEAVRRLEERDQVILALYYFEQLTLAEIGGVLGVTESRVSQLRTRATKALRAQLN